MSRPLLSVNIVSYNTRDITIRCLDSIVKSTHIRWLREDPSRDIEIILVDNASSDGTQGAVSAWSSSSPIPLTLIRNTENEGFGRGHNKAAKESKGEYILLLNTDTIVTRDSLCTFMESFLSYNPSEDGYLMQRYPHRSAPYRVHFAGPRLLNANLTPQPSCGPYYSIPVIIGALFARGDHWGLTRMSPRFPRQVDWVSGACILCRTSDFLEIGGFDESIFMYMEEIDLLYRAKKNGMQVWCLPPAEIIHLGSASSNKIYPIFQVYRGFLYLYSKHHSRLELRIVQWLLTFKASLVIMLGSIIKRLDLVHTYTEALKIVRDSYQSSNP